MKTRNIKITMFMAIFLLSVISLNAQVTIGSEEAPEKAALLDIKTNSSATGQTTSDGGGLLLPRVEIDDINILGVFGNVTGLDTPQEMLKHKGLTVYNIGTTNVEAGAYIWDGLKWKKAGLKKEINFFYMPSITIDLSLTPTPIDLYDEYKQQFLQPKVRSTGAPVEIPYFPDPEDLYYYITYYDEDIFTSISIDKYGEMTYVLENVLPANICCSFINIVFVVK